MKDLERVEWGCEKNDSKKKKRGRKGVGGGCVERCGVRSRRGWEVGIARIEL